MDAIKVQVSQLVTNPDQMRTRMGLQDLASLALQVWTRGMDDHHPLLVSLEEGDADPAVYRIVSGHRRKAAALVAAAAQAAADRPKQTDAGLVGFILETLGIAVGPEDEPPAALRMEQVEDLQEKLAAHAGAEVPAVLFEGDLKAELLALMAANFGQEEPDVAGQARAYSRARERGISIRKIAANTGKSAQYVSAALALEELPGQLAEAIGEGKVALGVATELGRLDEARRMGAGLYIVDAGVAKVHEVRAIVGKLQKYEPAQLEIDEELTPHDRNKRRATAAAWAAAIEEDPELAWKAAAEDVHRGYGSLLGYLGYKGGPTMEIVEALRQHDESARCDKCKLREVLAETTDIFRAYNRAPCQKGEEVELCVEGCFRGDPFWVEVPYALRNLPGVEQRGYQQGCSSAAALRQAAAAAQEQGLGGYDDEVKKAAKEKARREAEPPAILKQRGRIAAFMAGHEKLSGYEHALATRCGECAWKLEGSPTDDPEVARCQWAAEERYVEFYKRTPQAGKDGLVIPRCCQYAPTRTWEKTLPAYPRNPGFSRELLVRMSCEMGENVENCELLTGQPLGRDDDWKGIPELVRDRAADLSDRKLATLFEWVAMEWMAISYGDEEGYLLRLDDGRMVPYIDRKWEG